MTFSRRSTAFTSQGVIFTFNTISLPLIICLPFSSCPAPSEKSNVQVQCLPISQLVFKPMYAQPSRITLPPCIVIFTFKARYAFSEAFSDFSSCCGRSMKATLASSRVDTLLVNTEALLQVVSQLPTSAVASERVQLAALFAIDGNVKVPLVFTLPSFTPVTFTV